MPRPHAPSSRRRSFHLLFTLSGVLLWGPPGTAMSPPDPKSQTAPYYEEGFCGDWMCSVTEDCSNCPDDCGYCYCGDGICQPSESCSDCSYDCGSCSENRWAVVGTKRYWADYASNAVWRSNLDGSQVELAYGVNGPYGIAYDPAAGQLIWTSSTDETVQAAPLGGGSIVTLHSSFEESFAIAFEASGQSETTAASSTTSLAYGVIGSEVVKVTQDIYTGAEQREVLLTLSSSDEVHGLTLSADGASLYLGDPVGRMSRKLNIATHEVQWLVFEEGGLAFLSSVRSKEEGR